MSEDTVLCLGEGKRYPRSQFSPSTGEAKIHEVADRHTVLGDPVNGNSVPVELPLPDADIPDGV
jgi:hypothetical protein